MRWAFLASTNTYFILAKTSFAACSVNSMSSSEWAAEIKPVESKRLDDFLRFKKVNA